MKLTTKLFIVGEHAVRVVKSSIQVLKFVADFRGDCVPRHKLRLLPRRESTQRETLLKESHAACDGARVNARYVFDKARIKWGSLVITRDVSAGSELYVKYGDKAVTWVVFEGTNGEAPEELTVLLAKSASAMQYEALTLRGREPAERIAEIHQAAERYQKVPCECNGACSLHFMLQTCWDYVYITCAFKRWRRSNLSDAPRSSSTLHDRIVPHGRRGRVDFSDAVHPEPAGAAAHRAVRLAAGLPCSKPIQCNHHRLMF
eukprot:COSAG02_NODE_7084_length_3193_cov_5.630575_1_plen_260_part_00